MVFRTRYNYGPTHEDVVNAEGKVESVRKYSQRFQKPSRTKGSFKDECDINQIVARSRKTGMLGTMQDELRRGKGNYGDYADPQTFQDSLNLVIYAQEQFASLPSAVRDRFGNDPQTFLAFAADGKNAEEMAKMGLMDPEAVIRVTKAREEAAKATEGEGTPKPSEKAVKPKK